ncbi:MULTISPECIES: hypothetical protein [Photorhabdus]|uniref:hypothetical protein n=1 Tax=Photorhabdus TaxID=29487 RepID=UPI000DCDA3BC|nr:MULTISPECIES: hypothetical protein [Photorhabdus]MCT8341856.1 hypothetical protein [Photorhabdus kleinii]RAX03732.1 hypothetical protein CKY03_02155 [Photorhabdus sp. S9-53]RAX04045.1 hypothetical protein CKY05_02155 [Photorhabdus sp. S10-54]RAX06081.1 hypothetical protein CKY04_02155 [Photorhabdus sp. S8-52]
MCYKFFSSSIISNISLLLGDVEVDRPVIGFADKTVNFSVAGGVIQQIVISNSLETELYVSLSIILIFMLLLINVPMGENRKL